MAKPPIFWVVFWCVVELSLGVPMVLLGWTFTAWVFGIGAGFMLGMLYWRMTLRDIWEEQHGTWEGMMGPLGGLSEAEARIAELEAERDALAARLAVLEQAAQALVYGGGPVLLGVTALHDALVQCDQMEVADGCGSSDGRRSAGGAGSLADPLGRAADAPDGPAASTSEADGVRHPASEREAPQRDV